MLTLAVFARAAEPAAHAGEAAAKAGLPQMDVSTFPSQLFWLALTFGFLYWLMSTIVLPRLGGAIEERRDRIADDFDQAAEFRRQAEDAQKAYESDLADAKARARAIAAEKRSELDEELAERHREADAQSAAAIEAAEARIKAMHADKTAKVREAAAETARAVVEALIDEKPTAEAVEAAIARATRA